MIWRFFRQDIVWAGLILLIALSFGQYRHWQLVQAGWQGQLSNLKDPAIPGKKNPGQGKGPPVKVVELPEAWELFQQKQALIIDARPTEDYAELHIFGAINLPLAALLKEGEAVSALKGVTKDHKIMVYCGSNSCENSVKVAAMLFELGYTQVKLFLGGLDEWDAAGYPMDTDR